MRKNIYVFTATGDYKYYPEFISVNRDENDKVSIDVRSPERLGSTQACVDISKEEAKKLAHSLMSALG